MYDYNQSISYIRNLLIDVPRKYLENNQIVSFTESAISDIEHQIELQPLDAKQLVRAASKIKKLRQQRREAKDENIILQPLYDFCRTNAKIKPDLDKVLAECKKIERDLNNRTYTPKTKITLTDSSIELDSKIAQWKRAI